MSTMQTNNTERIAYIDYLRVIACFLVMLVHASENFYGADSSVGLASNCSMLLNESNRFWVAFYDGFVGRTCVPLFMIASAFLLVPMKPVCSAFTKSVSAASFPRGYSSVCSTVCSRCYGAE